MPSEWVTDITSLLQVVLIDLALSADNAIAVGLAAGALEARERDRAIRWGIFIALILRIAFGFAAVQMLQFNGILTVGGLLLIWIAWRMWLDLSRAEGRAAPTIKPAPNFGRAIFSIVVANVALSLDNVIAVAGVSRHSPWIMAFGLILSVLLMGVAASIIARVVERVRLIGLLGILAILVAATGMSWDDGHTFFPTYVPEPPAWLAGSHT